MLCVRYLWTQLFVTNSSLFHDLLFNINNLFSVNLKHNLHATQHMSLETDDSRQDMVKSSFLLKRFTELKFCLGQLNFQNK